MYSCKIQNLKVGSVPIVVLPILLIQEKSRKEICNNAIIAKHCELENQN